MPTFMPGDGPLTKQIFLTRQSIQNKQTVTIAFDANVKDEQIWAQKLINQIGLPVKIQTVIGPVHTNFHISLKSLEDQPLQEVNELEEQFKLPAYEIKV